MKRILLVAAVVLAIGSSPSAHAETKPCGDVLMSMKTLPGKDHRAFVEKLGFYKIDGGLVYEGTSTCTSITIECNKTSRTCRTATATTSEFFGKPHVLGVFMSDDYTVTEWSQTTIRAELPIVTSGGTSQLLININDGTPDDVQIVNTTKSIITNPGQWVTEVLKVEVDPNLKKILP